MSEKALETENHSLRKNLRELSDTLTQIIEKKDFGNRVPKKKESKKLNTTEKEKIFNQEISNNEKIIQNHEEEYQTLEVKMDKAKNTSYFLDIQEKLDKIKNQIDDTKKTNKKLILTEEKSSKNLDQINKENGVEQLTQINNKSRELALLKKKISKLIEENTQNESKKDEIVQQMDELNNKYSKIAAVGDHYKILNQPNAFLHQHETLIKKIAKLDEDIKLRVHKNGKFLSCHFIRQIEDEKIVTDKNKELLERLDAMIKDQAQAIKDLLNRESLRSDRSVRDVISQLKFSMEDQQIESKKKLTENDTEDNYHSKRLDKPPLPKSTTNKVTNAKFSLENAPNETVSRKDIFFSEKHKDIIDSQIVPLEQKIPLENDQPIIEKETNSYAKPSFKIKKVQKNELDKSSEVNKLNLSFNLEKDKDKDHAEKDNGLNKKIELNIKIKEDKNLSQRLNLNMYQSPKNIQVSSENKNPDKISPDVLSLTNQIKNSPIGIPKKDDNLIIKTERTNFSLIPPINEKESQKVNHRTSIETLLKLPQDTKNIIKLTDDKPVHENKEIQLETSEGSRLSSRLNSRRRTIKKEGDNYDPSFSYKPHNQNSANLSMNLALKNKTADLKSFDDLEIKPFDLNEEKNYANDL